MHLAAASLARGDEQMAPSGAKHWRRELSLVSDKKMSRCSSHMCAHTDFRLLARTALTVAPGRIRACWTCNIVNTRLLELPETDNPWLGLTPLLMRATSGSPLFDVSYGRLDISKVKPSSPTAVRTCLFLSDPNIDHQLIEQACEFDGLRWSWEVPAFVVLPHLSRPCRFWVCVWLPRPISWGDAIKTLNTY